MATAFFIFLGLFILFFIFSIINMINFACKIGDGFNSEDDITTNPFKKIINNFSYHFLFVGITSLSFFGMLITGIIWLIQRFT